MICMHKLSQYRTPLMGVAILFIMLFHSGIVLKDDAMFRIFRNGDIGVEVFAVLSAIGVFSSLRKNSSTIQFYKRRFVRIVPTYILIAAPFALFRHYHYGASWGHVISLSLGLSTLQGDITYWFVTFIMICYLVAPFLFYLKRLVKIRFLLTTFSIIVSVLLFELLRERISCCDVWLLRFPSFVLGFDIADCVLSENKVEDFHNNVWQTILSFFSVLAILLVVWITTQFGNVYTRLFCYLVAVIPLMLALCRLLDGIAVLIPSLSFLGAITLELYLLHERICLSVIAKLGLNNWMLMLLGIMFAVASAWAISKGVNTVRKHLSTKD